MSDALKPCPFCGGEMQCRFALWPSEGDYDGVLHVSPTDCPLGEFSDGSADSSIFEKWNTRAQGALREAPDVTDEMVEAMWLKLPPRVSRSDCRRALTAALAAAPQPEESRDA